MSGERASCGEIGYEDILHTCVFIFCNNNYYSVIGVIGDGTDVHGQMHE